MEIKFFLPQGPQPTEMAGLEDIRATFPKHWKGYANFVMRQPQRRGQDREIDIVIVTPDRIILVDLKHIRGRIENRGGIWHRDADIIGASPAHKIRDNAKVLASLIRSEIHHFPAVPPVESLVVLTHPQCDPSGLDQVERDRTLKLSDFLKITREQNFRNLFTGPTKYSESNSLCSGQCGNALQKFFSNGKLFEPRKTRFHGFMPVGDPAFKHPLFEEFSCHQSEDPNYTGLLRLWDFSVDGEFIVEEARRPIAERERAVLGHIRVQDPALYENYVLRSLHFDSEYTLRYSEIFDCLPDLERLSRYHSVLNDLTFERRTELARLFLDRIASLHRIRVAHRDLDRHSIWIDERRSKVVLSSFGAAHFPERKSIGGARSKLLAGGYRVPEDVGESQKGTPFQQDVFLAGAVVWNLLVGARLEEIDGVPVWSSRDLEDVGLPDAFQGWFERCLKINANERYESGVDAADAFAELLRKTEKASLERQLDAYRRDIDPISDYEPSDWISKKPYRIYKSLKDNESHFVKSWPERILGERRKSAARLIEFFGKADALRRIDAKWLPRISVACLCTDGLLLIQDWVDGEKLSACDVSTWTPEGLRRFVVGLIDAVDELHKLELNHGDISPENILVCFDGDIPRPVLVDVVDFSADDIGRSTPAYCPAEDNDLRSRDRYAVGQIALELAEACTDAETKALLRLGAGKCAEGAAPWLTLKALKDAVVFRRVAPTKIKLDIEIETPRTTFEGAMLSDNGVFHIVKSKRAPDSIEVFGFDQRVTIDFDPKDAKPVKAIANRIDMGQAAWAQRHRLLSFEGSLKIVRSRSRRFVGLDHLPELVASHLGSEPVIAKSEAAPKVTDAPDPAAPTTKPATQKFPVEDFWNGTILAEDEISPEFTLAQEPSYDRDERTLHLIAEDNLPEFESGDGQSISIQWNGYKLGDLDTERSRGTTVVVRNVRNVRGLNKGAVLKIPDDLVSFQRRSRAVGRILDRKSQIPNLIGFFDPAVDLAPQTFGPEIDDAILSRYGLNPAQNDAFKHLWRYGPLGLLQGPPGTGKTTFIAAFVHYALTELRLKNVLVLSQSHEAVNAASEKILQTAAKHGGNIEMLRVGQHSKISPILHNYHAFAIQDRYRELFRAAVKERVLAPLSRLGLERDYIYAAVEIENSLGSLLKQIEFCEQDIATSRDQDTVAAAHERLEGLNLAWADAVEEHGVSPELDPRSALEEIRDTLADQYSVHDVDARRRLLRVHGLALEWGATLGMRGRSLEELIARSRNLISGTCVGIGRYGIQVDRNVYDLVIIDEAARCTPGELAVGMQSGRRVILVGDHKQLPPLYGHELIAALGERLNIRSKRELNRSDFERAFHSAYGKAVARTLTSQYRMAPKIGKLVAETFYPGQELETERGGAPKYYEYLPRPLDDEMVWIDTGHSKHSRREREAGSSFVNRTEAAVVISLLKVIAGTKGFVDEALVDLREEEPLVGVICMYAPQVGMIEEMLITSDLSPDFQKLVKVGTVDSYQGKENRIVILSLVRSNPERNMGFVRAANRINVALSRAMERLIIVGSTGMFERNGNALAPVIKHLKAGGRVLPSAGVLQ
ncbi:ATPase [Rhodopseudomonas sp. AAP120]|uniref:AAA domain-containing protein n=1 Tax=Rhodopseudomonas TaxID=1073 RepID=UPI000164A61F|nr:MULTISPECIES: AAA domain-containing protein [Rhodopseudomonas]ACF00798.1 NERD domain protein [Rhodopseudomonas palustris TIE-1]KPG01769.1 ATPase [Rhodopseudomonas sp. AAP120]